MDTYRIPVRREVFLDDEPDQSSHRLAPHQAEPSPGPMHGYAPRIPLAPVSQDAVQAFRRQYAVSHSLAGRRPGARRIIFKPERPSVRERVSGRFRGFRAWSAARLQGIGDLSAVFRVLEARKAFAVVALAALGWGGVSFVVQGLRIKGEVLGMSTAGAGQLQAAVDNIKDKDFSSSASNFSDAAKEFGEASKMIGELNGSLVELSRFIPGASKLASGKYAVEAGEHLALAGQTLNGAAEQVWSARKDPEQVPLLGLFKSVEQSATDASGELRAAQDALDKVDLDDIPEDKRAQFADLKEKLPTVILAMQTFLDHGAVLNELFGGNGPRKYLFLLQNNQEARATGGFIGTYALLDITNGRIRKFFIDGIFNPDGQFAQNIVPPVPLQKVTGGWSLHDSNWFPDFPVSARKAISFYEKTGGPTVDGVITLTPVVIQKLLDATGPVTLDQYGVTLDSENFMALVQDQVEFKYDKTLNKPKQILADLAPVLLDRVAGVNDEEQAKRLLKVVEDSLAEKHILLYSQNSDIERLIGASGWSGGIIQADKDYLSVVNTNVSGYKTDGVVDETIDHHADIAADGTVVDTVTVTRKHNGGHSEYDFWNRVNADYMRVYVPEGSELISAEGQTRETVKPPLDYDALRFSRDPDVEAFEASETVDQDSGTRIYTDAGKTVFANWVYVSPQETVTVKYRYRLPFKVGSADGSGAVAGSYGIIFQKQSGSVGSVLTASLSYPDRLASLWQTPETLSRFGSGVRMETDLRTDRFYGIVFGNKE